MNVYLYISENVKVATVKQIGVQTVHFSPVSLVHCIPLLMYMPLSELCMNAFSHFHPNLATTNHVYRDLSDF